MAETEIIARRCKWTPDEKAALLAEVEGERGRFAKIARRPANLTMPSACIGYS
jgi:hypothetical protein